MLKSIQGVYRDGKIELSEVPEDILDKTPVIVTFLGSDGINLEEHGIDTEHATQLRTRLASFTEEWESSEMDIYDDYDASRT